MHARTLSRFLFVCGATLLLTVFALFGPTGGTTTRAQTMPPRPTLATTATSAPATATPEPAYHAPRPTPVPPPGRITGTVIDQRTGAPTPGVTVTVGTHTLLTDSNGNYDVNGLVPGRYVVTLILTAAQGTAAQGPVTVTVAAGQTVVQHLFFFSPAPAEPTVSAPTTAPTPSATPVVPATLPVTGGHGATNWPWLLLGTVLVGAGLALRRGRL
ncbi:MAG: carboxypeptidase-like regulatory domain-containing protein [Chloroflexales bacterium]